MPVGSQDAAIFLADFGVTAVVDVTSATVVFEPVDEISQMGGQSMPGAVVGKPTMLFETNGKLKGKIANNVAITVDGTKYTISGAPRVKDDLYSVADLELA